MSARVVISGNLGVGKTTFGPVVANALGGIFVNESVEDNPYLDDYYRDMSRWAFHLQVHFLVNRVKTYTAPSAKECPIVFDRSFFEDANVFAPMLHDAGHLTDQEYKTYKLLDLSP